MWVELFNLDLFLDKILDSYELCSDIQTNEQTEILLFIYRYTSAGTHPCLETKFFLQKSTFST